ncbi:MAG: response regulator transcription factor [Bacteroidia bacterium]|nr:response regulator transcription factor [Bacteroidia bacterium]MBL4715673.1 response regulator transcription factor [Bacteroidia bacterium]
MKILIVEDEEMSLKALEHKLSKKGYTVYTATNGEEALKTAKTRGLDLIISDIMMPYKSGIELLDIVRNNLDYSIPFILTTSINEAEITAKSFELGASDFIIKPINFNELFLRIERLLRDKVQLAEKSETY